MHIGPRYMDTRNFNQKKTLTEKTLSRAEEIGKFEYRNLDQSGTSPMYLNVKRLEEAEKVRRRKDYGSKTRESQVGLL